VSSSDTYLHVRQPVFVLGLFVLTLTFGIVIISEIVGNMVLEEKITSLTIVDLRCLINLRHLEMIGRTPVLTFYCSDDLAKSSGVSASYR
jgi:hypothetical protein